METITDTDIYQYTHEVIVELRGVDARGDPTVLSYHFRKNDDELLHLQSEIDNQYREIVEAMLTDAGYNGETVDSQK
ncbi:hypothetical protein [Haladaptatus halobius]|uniref:hypothetical protein n=1 Tax=Haladaptatus halobius TaxID=2884875 RepID=UPI001D0BC553|nr:hypothetical protein [Haladaptatus halobius]